MRTVRIDLEDGRHDPPSVDSLVAHDGQLQDVFQRDKCSFVKP